jgi:hypothetical protein
MNMGKASEQTVVLGYVICGSSNNIKEFSNNLSIFRDYRAITSWARITPRAAIGSSFKVARH